MVFVTSNSKGSSPFLNPPPITTLSETVPPPAHIRLRPEQLTCEMCVIRLHDAWARFCRELVVLSAYAQPLTAQGHRVPRTGGIKSRRDVIPALIATYPRRKTEPPWHFPRECIDAARRLSVSNNSTIASGLGLSFPQSPTNQLTQMRNFLAHRNTDTAQDVAQVAINLGMPNIGHPHLLVASVMPPGVPLFVLWAERLGLMAWLAIQ